jgi:hypothetical protein
MDEQSQKPSEIQHLCNQQCHVVLRKVA